MEPLQLTELLKAWGHGDRAALEQLVPLVEAELRRMARRYMRSEQSGHLLQTTALVNEAFLKLVDQRSVRWQNRAHFYAIAAQCMRRVLLNHARSERRLKRGGGARRVSFTHAEGVVAETNDDLLALDEALKQLALIDELKSKVVELRYFGGLSIEETAKVLRISPMTVIRHWNLARAWLRREMSRAD
jgi:RNA polymerase sigma factor (TIGR02999 family)